MPSSPLPLCLECSSRVIAGTKYCATHQDAGKLRNHFFERYRAADPIRALYRNKRWQNTRRIVFKRDILCRWPDGCPHAANTCDHFPLSARDIVAQFGVDEFYNPDRSRGLCKPHHDVSTAAREGAARGH
jgi:hypothetical protein